MRAFQYARPADESAALDLHAAHAGAMFVGGGTNLVDLMTQGALHPDLLIDLNRLPHRGATLQSDGGLSLGALTTMAAAARSPEVGQRFPLLVQAIFSGATPQIHHAATLGGNLLQKTRCTYYRDPSFPCNKRVPGSGCPAIAGCHRSHAIFGASPRCIAVHPSDLAVALTALDAVIHTRDRDGERRTPIREFYRLPGDTPEVETVLAPGELILSIELPAPWANTRATYWKVDEHNSLSFAVVSLAAVIDWDGHVIRDLRLACGGVAHKPWRLFEAEDLLRGRTPDDPLLARAAAAALAPARSLPQNAAKVELLRRGLRLVINQLLQSSV